jgi:membrane glycosyltransferase
MIEANKSSLGEFLKNKGVETFTEAVNTVSNVAPPVNNPIEPINNAVINTTDSLDKFTNLLESINKLLNSPLISGIIQNGTERKSQPKQEIIEVPEGYNPPNSIQKGTELKRNSVQETNQETNKREKAELLYNALLKSIEEMVKIDSERTIKSIYEELNQEIVKEQLIKQMRVLM